MKRTAFAIALAAGATLATLALLPQGTRATPPAAETLRAVADFDAISDVTARSQALFTEMARVLTHPRCINCHPANRFPTQGDDKHPHVPLMNAAEGGMGTAGIMCGTCHGSRNRTIVGSKLKSIPGAEPWLLAPASMGWQGLTVGQICEQVKDLKRNGNRSLADIQKHLAEDHLVAWAWHPGEGRTPAPGTQEQFGALAAAWIKTGGACPK